MSPQVHHASNVPVASTLCCLTSAYVTTPALSLTGQSAAPVHLHPLPHHQPHPFRQATCDLDYEPHLQIIVIYQLTDHFFLHRLFNLATVMGLSLPLVPHA